MAIFIFACKQIKNSYANRLNNKACRTENFEVSKQLLYKAIRLNTDNPVYRLNLALLYAIQDSSINTTNFINGTIVKSAYSDSTLLYCLQADAILQNNPLFALNTGILYFMHGENDKAKHYFEKTINDENDIWNLLSVGIMYEHENMYDSAKYTYIEALIQMPELLDSRFFSELKNRNNIFAKDILLSAIQKLQSDYDNNHDPLIAAKLGKFMKNNGDITNAKKYLTKSVNDLPALNRPWLYLGEIAEQQGDSVNAMKYYERAELLDGIDILPKYRIGKLENKNVNFENDIDMLLKHRISNESDIYRHLFNVLLMPKHIVLGDYEKFSSSYYNFNTDKQ